MPIKAGDIIMTCSNPRHQLFFTYEACDIRGLFYYDVTLSKVLHRVLMPRDRPSDLEWCTLF